MIVLLSGCAHALIHMDARCRHRMSSWFILHLIHSFIHSLIWDIVCHWVRSSSIQLAWLTSELQSCLSPPSAPQHLIKDTYYSPRLLCVGRGSRLMASHLQSRHLAHWAIPKPSRSFYLPWFSVVLVSKPYIYWARAVPLGYTANLWFSHFSFSGMVESDWI